MELTAAQWAYTAGVIDGEGCLAISKRMARGGVNYSYRAECVVVQHVRGKAMIDALHAWHGGAVHTLRNGNLALRLAGADTRRLVEGMRDYSTIKREQCLTLLEFFRTFDGAMFGTAPLKGYLSPEVIEAREACFQRLHELHGGSKGRKRAEW